MTATTIIERSALVFHGHNPAPDVARVEVDHRGRHVVTWAEVMEERRRRQREILDRKRTTTPARAYKLWVAYFDQDLMGGWWAFLERASHRVWIDRDRPFLCEPLMELFPLVLRLEPESAKCRPNGWEHWKREFARQYRRRVQCRAPVGVGYVWWDGQGKPSPVVRRTA